MRKNQVLMAWSLIVSLVMSAGCGGSSMPAPKIVEIKGAVTVNGAAASPQKVLAPGDTVRAPHGAVARLEYPDGTRFLLVGKTQDGSELVVGKPTDESGVSVMLVKLGKGILSFLVKRDGAGKTRYEIEASSSLTVVRGTEGKVAIEAGGDLVALKKGQVDVIAKTGGATQPLTAGQQVTVAADGKMTTASYDISNPAEAELYAPATLMLKQLH